MRKYTCHIIALLFVVAFACKKEDPVRQPLITPPVEPPAQPPYFDTGNYTAHEIEGFKQMTVYTTQQIVKWQSPVSVYVADTSFSYMTKQVDSVIAEMNTLLDTNLTIRRTFTREGSSIQVYFTDQATYLALEPIPGTENLRLMGYGYAAWDSSRNIYYGSIFADTVSTAGDTLLQRFVIQHEFMHTLGFVGHVTVSTLSSLMFGYRTMPYLTDYTEYDKKMIRLLYNPAVKAGMNETELNAVIANL